MTGSFNVEMPELPAWNLCQCPVYPQAPSARHPICFQTRPRRPSLMNWWPLYEYHQMEVLYLIVSGCCTCVRAHWQHHAQAGRGAHVHIPGQDETTRKQTVLVSSADPTKSPVTSTQKEEKARTKCAFPLQCCQPGD